MSIGAASREGISIRDGLRPHCKIITDDELQHSLRHNTRIDVGAHDILAPISEQMGAANMTTSLGLGIVETTTAPTIEHVGSREFRLVGVHHCQDVMRFMNVGSEVLVVEDLDTVFDKRALKVVTQSGRRHIGHISESDQDRARHIMWHTSARGGICGLA